MERRSEGKANHWAELASDGVTVLRGEEPGTAVRIRLEPCARGGCVHLEQVAYSATIGWYRQKAFSVPRAMLGDLSRLLRMSDCVMPPAKGDPAGREGAQTLRLHAAPDPAPPHEEPTRRSG